MSKKSAMSKQDLINKIYERFPDTRNTNSISRSQLMEITSYIPTWLNNLKMSRGLYAITGGAAASMRIPQPPVSLVQVASATSPAQSATVSGEVTDFVPFIDETFVPFGNYKSVETIMKSGMFYPTFITGPTGNGKSTMIEQVCAKLRRPLIRTNINSMSDEDQLIGSKTLENGDIKIVEGPVLIAMRAGAVLLLDEIDAGSANTLLCLQPILEGKPYYFKLKNELIVPTPGFNIFATGNTKGKGSDDGRYIGTNVLNEAFLERFAVTLEQQYPSAAIEMKIVNNLMELYGCSDDTFVNNIVKWADAIRRTFDDGGVDENITTRRISHIVRAYAIFGSANTAVELCCNRFDQSTKEAFIKLFDQISGPADDVGAVINGPDNIVPGNIDF